MNEFQTHSCDVCGEQFRVACFSELQEKFKAHKCSKVNKRVERTEELKQAKVDQFVHDVTIDRIQQHNFDKLVHKGIVVSA